MILCFFHDFFKTSLTKISFELIFLDLSCEQCDALHLEIFLNRARKRIWPQDPEKYWKNLSEVIRHFGLGSTLFVARFASPMHYNLQRAVNRQPWSPRGMASREAHEARNTEDVKYHPRIGTTLKKSICNHVCAFHIVLTLTTRDVASTTETNDHHNGSRTTQNH